jgi:hypothetical protein
VQLRQIDVNSPSPAPLAPDGVSSFVRETEAFFALQFGPRRGIFGGVMQKF